MCRSLLLDQQAESNLVRLISMLLQEGALAVLLGRCHFDAGTKAVLRLVCRTFREQTDLSFVGLKPQQQNSHLDLTRFKNLSSLDISEAPLITAVYALACCTSLVELSCTSAQLRPEDLAPHTQVETLILVKPARGHPQNLNQIAASRLRNFSTEFTRNLDLPEALCSDLQVLQLGGTQKASITQKTLETICASATLRVLKLQHCLNGIKEPLQTLADMGDRLLELDISYNLRCKQLAGEGISLLKALVSLRSLNVSFTRVSSRNLLTLTGLTALQELRASACEILSEHIGGLAKNLSSLTCLDISASWELTSFGQGLDQTSFPSLENLYLNYSASLTSLAPLQSVRELSMAGYPLKQRILEGISQLQALTKLDISHYSPTNNLSDNCLASLTTLTALRSLNMGGALHVSDRGLQALSSLTQLSELDVSSCGVTTEGVEQLSSMTSLRNLRCLRCTGVELAAVRNAAIRLCVFRGHRLQELTPLSLLQ